MGRLTLRLSEELYQPLIHLAEGEGGALQILEFDEQATQEFQRLRKAIAFFSSLFQ